MTGFLEAVADYAFMRNAVLAGLLASIACGIMGTYVVVRRISYMAGGIAHCVLGGIGAAVYLAKVHGWEWLDPIHGALAAALAAAIAIGFVNLRAKERVDTVIGAVWAIGMAAGVLFLARTPGYGEDLMSYLFGNILMVSGENLRLMVGLDVVVVASALLFFKQFQSICFDEEFSRVRGIRADVYFVFLLVLTALTIVLLVTVVGIVMVIALLTIPAAVAGRFATRLSHMMAAAVLASVFFTTAGLAASYGPDLPAGATIIVMAGVTYLAVAIATRVKRTVRGGPPAQTRAGCRGNGHDRTRP